MKLTDAEQKKLIGLAKSTKGTFLIEYLNKVKDNCADVRIPFTTKPEIERDVRLALCDKIEELLIEPLRRLSDDIVPPTDTYN